MPGVTGRGKVPPGDGAVSQWRAQALRGVLTEGARLKRCGSGTPGGSSRPPLPAAWRSAVTAPARPHGGADISKRGVCTGQKPYRTEGQGDST
jgi:hypothetical protein